MTAAESERELTQDEKRATLANDIRQPPATLHAFAQIEAEMPRGRFTATERATVIGVGPPSYPQLPASSPWAADPVPAENPLNLDVNAMPPCGEPHEIAASIAAQDAPPPEQSSPAQVPGSSTAASPSSSFLGVERVELPSFSKNKGNDDDAARFDRTFDLAEFTEFCR
jgi:hypothetical protein